MHSFHHTHVYSFGGRAAGYLNNAYKYSPEADTFTPIVGIDSIVSRKFDYFLPTVYPKAAFGVACIALNSVQILACGGSETPSTPMANCYLYPLCNDFCPCFIDYCD